MRVMLQVRYQAKSCNRTMHNAGYRLRRGSEAILRVTVSRWGMGMIRSGNERRAFFRSLL